MSDEKRFGYVALTGLPNAGKSTLLNALVGEKIAGVSRKVQTTRNRIVGLFRERQTEVALLDTPGLHKPRRNELLNRQMMRDAGASIEEADLCCYLIDVTRGLKEQDVEALKFLKPSVGKRSVLFVVTKIDRMKRFEWTPKMREIEALLRDFQTENEWINIIDTVALSAKQKETQIFFKEKIAEFMPVGPWLYGDGYQTDLSDEAFLAELIREQIYRSLGQELPYESAVRINEWNATETVIMASAEIIVARASQKGMVVGKKGAMIKEIGTATRKSLLQRYDTKVHLELSVTVSDNWHRDQTQINSLHSFASLESQL